MIRIELALARDWAEQSCSVWDDSDEFAHVPRDAVLHSNVEINCAMFHVTAIKVHIVEERQVAMDPTREEDLDFLSAFNGAAPFETVKIDGHDGDYVLAIVPFAL